MLRCVIIFCTIAWNSFPLTCALQQPTTNAAERLRQSLMAARSVNRAVPLIGVYDALSAKIMAQQYYYTKNNLKNNQINDAALFISGFGVSAARMGMPDAGLLTRTEMEDTTRNILLSTTTAAAAENETQQKQQQQQQQHNSIPVIVDGDTGYGGASNIRRTVRSFASLGAAALSIEDQTFPKTCTYAAGAAVQVIDRSESIKRIRTALKARDEAFEQDGNQILIIARTDCRNGLGLNEAIERCLQFESLGADIVYAEHLHSAEEYQQLRSCMADPETIMILAQLQQKNLQEQSIWNLQQIAELGYNGALLGVSTLQATVAALQCTSKQILSESNPNNVYCASPELASFKDLKDVVGFPELEQFESNYDCL